MRCLASSLWIRRGRGGMNILVCSVVLFLLEDLGFSVWGNGADNLVEKVGMERLKEALEANDWEASAELDDLGFEDFEDDGEDTESLGFGAEAAELEMEMVGMKQAIHGGTQDKEEDGGRDEDVEQLQAMMLRLQAVKGMFLIFVVRVTY